MCATGKQKKIALRSENFASRKLLKFTFLINQYGKKFAS